MRRGARPAPPPPDPPPVPQGDFLFLDTGTEVDAAAVQRDFLPRESSLWSGARAELTGDAALQADFAALLEISTHQQTCPGPF